MLAFGYIYIMILCMGIVSSLIYKRICGHTNPITSCAKFCAIYYFVICIFRTVVGNGDQYLGTSFVDKTGRAYIKVVALGIAVFCVVLIFDKIAKEKGQRYVDLVVGIFATLSLLYTILIDLPRMKVTVILGGVALVGGAILIFILKSEKWLHIRGESEGWNRYIEIGLPVLLYCSLFLLNGPMELFAYNTNDFVFNAKDFVPYMLIYSLTVIFFSVVLMENYAPQWMFSITQKCIFLYCICSYIQQMFLNGSMNRMEGNEQHWNVDESVGNLVVWLIIVALILLMLNKSKKSNLLISYISAFVAGVQLITFFVVMITTIVNGTTNQQLVENQSLNLSPNENVVVFILDAYDTQMLEKVLENDASYLEPLHDFTYYINMTSRYTATDGSLPYLLTGRIAEEENAYIDIYNESNFLKDIKENTYHVNILTERSYVECFENNIVDNRTADYYCILDYEKTVSQMSRCVRYRSTPFILKPIYYYENYDLTNVIYDTNVYLFGTDADFYIDLCQNGISIDKNMEHALQIYHLYGAHSPYYLTEDASLDYASNPIAQWKGCLKIVYDYLEQLKEKGLYDTTSVIIMADHGLNHSQRTAMDDWNITVSEESNPIFFLKKAGQYQEELAIDNREVSHDDFFATVMKLINSDAEQYGKAVWEK